MNSIRSVRGNQKLGQQVVAFSLSYDKDDGAPRGIGAEHLREALLQMARPLLRAQAAISYGGHLNPVKPPECNFTLDLLNLIREEQQERSAGNSTVRGLYNFQAWPFYLSVNREKEAEWINCGQIIRVTQRMAGITKPLPDQPVDGDAVHRFIHGAVCLSAMRRFMAEGCQQEIEGAPTAPRQIPKVSARIVLGGKMGGFAGIMPGIFEEVLTARETAGGCPIFILGGFGGAAGAIAHVLLKSGVDTDPRFTPEFYAKAPENPTKPGFTDLLKHWEHASLPAGARSPVQGFSALRGMLNVGNQPAAFLQNGLDDAENRRLLSTIDPTEAVRLVLRGLSNVM